MVDVKKKIRPGIIQLHNHEAALLVHYEVQEIATKADSTQEIVSSSQATKKITVKSLSEHTDLKALSAEIVEKCKLIHPSKAGLVEGLLQQLQRRELGAPSEGTEPPAAAAAAQAGGHAGDSRPSTSSSHSSGRGVHSAGAAGSLAAAWPLSEVVGSAGASAGGEGSGRPASARPQSASRPHAAGSSRASTPQQQLRQQQQQHSHLHLASTAQQQQQHYQLLQDSEAFQAFAHMLTRSMRPAFLDDVEVYIEALYEEELPRRAAAADMLCQLFRNSGNLPALLARETLLSTLARLLREDGPRSLDMATAVSGCFYACSCFKQIHRQLLDNQVGSLLMDLVALELQRSTAREAQEGPSSSAAAIATKAAATAAAATSQGKARQQQQQQQQQPLDQREFRLLSLVIAQDRFLALALATLTNLAEEAAVQRKMVKKDVVGLLMGLMTRPHQEVLLLVVGLLRRLCVFVEAKARLSAQPSVIWQLVALLHPGCGEQLQCAVLRLLHNLSFDSACRQQMMNAGLVQQAVPLLDGSRTAALAAGLLYQLSRDDAARAAFCFCPGGLARLHDSILRALGPGGAGAGGSPAGGLRSIPELIALAVNVAHSSTVAEWLSEGERLQRLLQRALATCDELAWKLLRNLAVSGGQLLAPCLLAHADSMLAILQSHNTGPELFVELLGTLAAAADAACSCGGSDGRGPDSCSKGEADGAPGSGSSTSSSVPPWQLMPDGVHLQDLLAFLATCLAPGGRLEDDALLEAVVLLGALAGWADGDAELAGSSLLHHLVDLLPAKRTDDEFVLQVCWAIRRALRQPASTNALLSHDQVVLYLVDLLQDSCVPVSRLASSCLDVIMDLNDDMAGAIRGLKFEAFNQEWLKLAGPEALQLMAAAAAWQQQQLHAYIHQQQQQQQKLLAGLPGTPSNTLREYPQGQQRRNAMSGYFLEQQQEHLQQKVPVDDNSEFEQAQRQEQELDGPGQQQLQWMSWPTGPGAAEGGDAGLQEGAPGASCSISRPSMVTAGGQCMVLDFDAFVSQSA